MRFAFVVLLWAHLAALARLVSALIKSYTNYCPALNEGVESGVRGMGVRSRTVSTPLTSDNLFAGSAPKTKSAWISIVFCRPLSPRSSSGSGSSSSSSSEASSAMLSIRFPLLTKSSAVCATCCTRSRGSGSGSGIGSAADPTWLICGSST